MLGQAILGLKNHPGLIKEASITEMKSSGTLLGRVSVEVVVQRWPRLYLVLLADLAMWYCLHKPGATEGFSAPRTAHSNQVQATSVRRTGE